MFEKLTTVFLQNNNLKQTAVKNVFWLGMSQISRLGRIAVLLYAARILGASEYGIFSYILSIVGILSIFADMGINPLLTRDAHQTPEQQKEYFATSFWIKLGLILLTVIIFLICAPFITNSPSVTALIPLAVGLIVFDNVRDFIVAYLRGLAKMERETLIVTVLNVVLAVAGFIVLALHPSPKNFFAAYVLASGIATISALFIARKNIVHIAGNFKRFIAKKIIKDGWPIALSGAFGLLMLNIDVFMLGLLSTTTSVGLYSAGQKIVQVLYIVPTLIASGIFPAMALLARKDDRERERNVSEKSMTMIFLFTIPFVIGGVILAKPVFEFVFGADYFAGISAFVILLLNTLFIFPGLILANMVLAHNKQHITFKYVIIAALVNIALNLLLIPRMGIVGAAIATLVSQIVNYGCIWFTMRKVAPFTLFGHLGKIFISAVVMGTACYFLAATHLHVLVIILIASAIYIGMLFILNEKILQDLFSLIKGLRNREAHYEFGETN